MKELDTMKKLMTLLAVMALLLVPSAAFAQDDGTVTVVHGVPDLEVDVWVNGEATLPGFTFGTVTDPLTLPAGDYDIEIYPAGTDPEGNDPALADTVTLPAGANASIVAHLDADGNPTLSVFVNDTSAIDAGNGRVTARHVAAAPTVDILANGDALFAGVANPNEGVADVPADTYNVQIVPAGETEPVVFETDLDIPEGTNVIAYAIGSLDGGSFTVVAQTIGGLGSAPEGVPTGTGGLAGGSAPFVTITLLAGLVAIAGGALVLRRSN
jgi:hypothetical protein